MDFPGSPSLKITDLSSWFGSSQTSPLTIDIPAGKHLVLSGPSGCGKSSLLKVICGLQPSKSGKFSWGGETITERKLGWWRQQFCYLPQLPVMGGESVEDALKLPWKLLASNLPVPDEKRCASVLNLMGLHQSLDAETGSLSGGEKQRLAVARALLLERPLWMMDEPTSALDENGRNSLLALLREQAVTIVSVSHDPVWVQSADEVYRMEVNHG